MKYTLYIILFSSLIYSQCPDGLIEDDCGDCWQPYCYCLSDHTPNFDISQNECEESGCWWIGLGGEYEPGDYEFCLFDPYWNASCTGCTDPLASNYDSEALIPCDDNCNEETGDCCEYELNNNDSKNLKKLNIENVHPNPFNPKTQITINVPYSDVLKINIYDISGKLITTLYENYTLKGKHSFVWNANKQPTGIYIISVSLNDDNDSYFVHLIK